MLAFSASGGKDLETLFDALLDHEYGSLLQLLLLLWHEQGEQMSESSR